MLEEYDGKVPFLPRQVMLVDSLPILRSTSFPSVLALPILPTYDPNGYPEISLFTKLMTILKRSTFGRDSLSDWISGNLTQIFQSVDFRSDNRTHAINLNNTVVGDA